MTYGWAILVIAVVLGVLFQLGVFGSANLTPKAAPGGCQVERTTAGTSLAGMCQGELPQYVAVFTGTSNSFVSIGTPSTVYSAFESHSFTVTGWVYITGSTQGALFNVGEPPTNNVFEALATTSGSNCGIEWYDWSFYICSASALSTNTWYFLAWTYQYVGNSNTNYAAGYIDGQLATSSTTAPPIASSTNFPICINEDYSPCTYNDGFFFPAAYMSNIQVYNTSLSSAEVLALYHEGIGGAPVSPQSIVGWWPLNSNTNDYSGNNDNGQSVNGVGYSGFWTNGYSAP